MRKGAATIVAVVSACWIMAAPRTAGAQSAAAPSQDASQNQTAVNLSGGTQAAANDVVLPLNLSTAKNVQVGSIDVRIAYPKTLMSFGQIEPGGLADSVDAEVKADVQPGAGPSEAIVHATLSTIHSGGSRLPIPAGPVAYLTFKIDRDAKPQSTTPLKIEARLTTTDSPPKAIEPVAASAGDIIVASGPVFGCFFYMH